MEKTVAVFHDDGVAQYSVHRDESGNFVARLLKYSGRSEHEPPQQLILHKEGKKWTDADNDKDLVEDIGSAIDLLNNAPEQPVVISRDASRNRDNEGGTRHP